MIGRKLLAVGALIAGLLLPAQAMAQYEAITDGDLNLRVGPGTEYGIIDVIPYGEVVDVYGCLEDVAWCDVEWYGLRGWVSAYYLVQPGTAYYLPQVYARVGVPIIVFSFDTYHDRYYRDRPWYKKRHGRWRGRDWRRDRRHRDRDYGDRDRRYGDHDRDRRDADRPRGDRRIERPRARERIERYRQRQETLAPRQQRREIQRSRQQRRDVQRSWQRSEQRSQRSREPQRSQRQQRIRDRIESHRRQ